jgi:hypothetical protein
MDKTRGRRKIEVFETFEKLTQALVRRVNRKNARRAS